MICRFHTSWYVQYKTVLPYNVRYPWWAVSGGDSGGRQRLEAWADSWTTAHITCCYTRMARVSLSAWLFLQGNIFSWSDSSKLSIINDIFFVVFRTSQNNYNLITVKPDLAVTFIKQPTCLKQPYWMFPKLSSVLIFTSAKPLFVLSLGSR